MDLSLNSLESDLSVALGGGATGSALAGGGIGAVVSSDITQIQKTLASAGSSVGGVLGSLGLSGFLQSAAASGNTAVTTQATALQSQVLPLLSKYAIYIVGVVILFMILRKK